MSGVKYVSEVKLEPVEGKIRRAYLPVQEDPVLFGVHSEVADSCPVAASVKRSIEISSELDLTLA